MFVSAESQIKNRKGVELKEDEKKMMADNFPNLAKDRNFQIQEDE